LFDVFFEDPNKKRKKLPGLFHGTALGLLRIIVFDSVVEAKCVD
jgi:hypothetical protein